MLSRLLTATAVAVVLAVACGDENTASLSQRGEGCERHTDCGSSLACVAGVCTEGSFDVPPTGNECVRIECELDSDCCEESSLCQTYRDMCADGDQTACSEVDLACICNSTCEDNRCTTSCDEDNPCPGGLYCESEQCVQCQCDAHCDAGEVCKDARCRPQCRRDADCPRFHQCQNSECVDVGCSSDRECVAALESVLAFCDSGECRERCSSDIECGNAENFAFRACVEGTCRDVGCETDEECRAVLTTREGWSGLAECRPRSEPRPEGVPGVGGDECPTPTTCDDSCLYAFNGTCDEPSLCDPGTDCTDCRCGNGRLDTFEDCDGTNFGGETCETWTGVTGATGTLTCTATCSISSSSCSGGTITCGDGIAEGIEECDGSDLNGETCSTATSGLYPNGSLYCDYSCRIDTSGCTGNIVCGDGVAEGTEECDGFDLNGETCSTATFGAMTGGSLSCDSFCSLDTSGCVAAATCGNGIAEGTEECDTSDLNGETCNTATSGAMTQGTLACDSFCALDTSGCTSCGDGTLDIGEDCDTTIPGGVTCSTETGGTLTAGSLACTSSCTIDTSGCAVCQDTCVYANDTFCDEPTLCATGTDCTDCGG